MTSAPPSLRTFALAALARWLGPPTEPPRPEAQLLLQSLDAVMSHGDDWVASARAYLEAPRPEEVDLLRLGHLLGLSLLELLTTALVAAIEEDALVGRAVAFLQEPLGASRSTLGLVSRALAESAPADADPLHALATGPALASGLLLRLREEAPLAEQTLAMPLPLCLALSGHDAAWPGTTLGLALPTEVPLPPSVTERATRYATSLRSTPNATLVLRTGSPPEGRSAAAAVARALGLRPLYITGDRLTGLGPYLLLRGLLPIFCYELAPGERKILPTLANYQGPVLILAGPDGTIETAQGGALSWSLPVPERDERRLLWEASLGEPALAAELSVQHRQGSGRISQLGRLARQSALISGRSRPLREDVTAAAWADEGGGMGALAQPLPERISDEALVIPTTLRNELNLLLMRCRGRDGLVEGLGPSATARYHPGVRALFVGPSGTGKTLAAGWLATRLGLPVYRVDLASVTSKYIGETEKNLAQLFARAEHADVILLFDEADSLFGKRTDVKDSNDRFANAQTNYLLQRIEAFDGVALLTSNSKSRFDSAFTRRLDAVIEFPLPGPEERRALWLSHLGPGHRLPPRELGRIAATADLSGGQIRNVVLTAAVLARDAGRPIEQADVLQGLASEYKKLGREIPVDLRR